MSDSLPHFSTWILLIFLLLWAERSIKSPSLLMWKESISLAHFRAKLKINPNNHELHRCHKNCTIVIKTLEALKKPTAYSVFFVSVPQDLFEEKGHLGRNCCHLAQAVYVIFKFLMDFICSFG